MNMEWILVVTVRAVSRGHSVYRTSCRPFQKEVVVPRRGMGTGRPRTRYYIDDDPREFRSEGEMVRAFEIECKKEQQECGTGCTKEQN